jgi:hypothetical protein
MRRAGAARQIARPVSSVAHGESAAASGRQQKNRNKSTARQQARTSIESLLATHTRAVECCWSGSGPVYGLTSGMRGPFARQLRDTAFPCLSQAVEKRSERSQDEARAGEKPQFTWS